VRGLSACAAAKDAGAELVLVTGYGPRDAERLEVAKRFGADITVDVAEENPTRVLRAATGGRLADVVVDVTAKAPSALGQAVSLARTGGKVVLAGTRGSDDTPGFSPDHVVYKELHLIGALGVDATAYVAALDLLASDRWPFAELPRRSVGLDGVEDLVRTMAGEGQGDPPVHAVIAP
jgi:alcohol dehydrogenase